MIRVTILLLFCLFFLELDSRAQCGSAVNYAGWVRYGELGTIWTPTGNTVVSGTSPFYNSFYVGPDTLMNVKITGTIQVNTAADDDYVGFVFSYHTPLIAGNNGTTFPMDFWLFDWKQSAQTWSGFAASEGMSLCRSDTLIPHTATPATNNDFYDRFWVHNSSPNFQVVQTNYGPTAGWNDFQAYDFELRLSPTRAMIFIDNVLIFDEINCFEPGLFGFYEMSQETVTYSNFSYSLWLDFQIASQDVCLGDTAFFTYRDSACYAGNAFTNIDTFYWDLGDGTVTNDTNPWHIYTAADTFVVSLIATDIFGCTDTISKDVRIYQLPQAAFSVSNFCEGDSSIFTDQTQVVGDTLTNWFWDFGDGVGTSTDTSPHYQYQSYGAYNLTFAVQTGVGCVDTLDTLVTIYEPPAVNFSIQSACDGDTVFFSNLSNSGSFPITSYSWDVQNNQSVDYTTFNASHLYPVFDIYSVKLEALDAFGCSDSLVKIVDVHPLPNADFVADAVCFGAVTVFYDSSSVINGTISQQNWSINNGQTILSGPTPSYQFLPGDNELVTLTVASDSGCLDSVSKTITLFTNPTADFTYEAACESDGTSFTQLGTTLDGVIDTWYWNIGGIVSNSSNPIENIPNPGLTTVELIVETNYGCRDTIQKEVRVYPNPTSVFSWANNVCEGEEISFSDQSQIQQISPGGDFISGWNWIINGNQFSTQNPVYQSLMNGEIGAKLIVSSNNGCVDSSEAVAFAFSKPEVDFGVDLACQSFPTQFTNNAKVDIGLVSAYSWDFGDGSTSLDENPSHIYSKSGSYSIIYKATTNKTCFDSITKTITIPESPKVDFEVLDSVSCSPNLVRIQNLSSIDSGSINYRWLVNGNLTTTAVHPELYLTNESLEPIDYTIKLVGQSNANCAASKELRQAVTVLPSPIAQFEILKDSLEPFDEYAPLLNTSKNGIKWFWDFGNGTTSNDFEPFQTYDSSGVYIIRLKAENIWKCADSTYKTLVVKPFITMYIPSGFTPNGDGINDVWQIKGFNENRELALRVYDRWGKVIFYTTDLSNTWDGTTPKDGEEIQNGTYLYSLRFFVSDTDVKEITGQITLLR